MTQPESAKQLSDYIRKATENRKRVRMTGSGHSASDVAITNEVLFTPEKLNKPLTLQRTRLKNPNEPRLVRVMSGIRIRDLNDYLDKNGLALFNMGGYDGQTIAGVMMTATHGSGLAYGPIADQAWYRSSPPTASPTPPPGLASWKRIRLSRYSSSRMTMPSMQRVSRLGRWAWSTR
jgi:hypothetical protein